MKKRQQEKSAKKAKLVALNEYPTKRKALRKMKAAAPTG
jgi:hypothetical protein